MAKADVLLVTVNKHETQAILAAFTEAAGRDAIPVPISGRVYRDLGIINKTHVFHALSEMGSVGLGATLQTVDKGIQALNPSAVIAIGIAFGINESQQRIGDILISKQLQLYDMQRVEHKIILRGDKPHASPALVNFFEGIAQSTWNGCTIRSGVILTGEKLVDNIDYRSQLLAFESEAVGGEMEGAGLYVASHERKVDWIVIKAICDWADGDKLKNKKGRQRKAAQNAAEFLVFALQQTPLNAIYDSHQVTATKLCIPPRSTLMASGERRLATAPTPFFIHPYSLLQTADVVGREDELSLLDKWGQSTDSVATVISIGGMGKSALTWKWFTERSSDHITDLPGRIWWSFYEEDSAFGTFVKHALAYITDRSLGSIREPFNEQVEQLHYELTKRPWLIVFDGFERQLKAYSQLDTAQAILRTESHSETADHCSDERVARFLRQFARQKVSKLLISSRLVPSELTTVADSPLPQTQIIPLRGLRATDAIQLWQQLGNSGSEDELAAFFDTFDGHPLLIQALGREVATWRENPGDFGAWRTGHPDFDPFELPLHQRKSHILHFATKNLSTNEQRVLQTVAHFRVPSRYFQLRGMLVGSNAPFSTIDSFDSCLSDLERRGLLSWDKYSNTYDMHPVIRGFVWSGLDESQHSSYYVAIEQYFKSVPIPTAREITSIEQVSPAIELYNALVRTKQYEEAYLVYTRRLRGPLRTLVAARLTQTLLYEFFDDPQDLDSCVLDGRIGADYQPPLLRYLANSHIVCGEPQQCRDLLKRAAVISADRMDFLSRLVLLGHLVVAHCVLGELREAHDRVQDAREILNNEWILTQSESPIFRIGQIENHTWSGLLSAICGKDEDVLTELSAGLALAETHRIYEYRGLILAIRGRHEYWAGQYQEAKSSARTAMKIAQELKRERDSIQVGALLGRIAIECGEIEDARTVIIQARQKALSLEYVSGEFAVLCAEVHLLFREGDIDECIRLSSEGIVRTTDAGYRLELVDLLVSRAECYEAQNQVSFAQQDAIQAIELAGCDGGDYSFAWGMRRAGDIVRRLSEMGE